MSHLPCEAPLVSVIIPVYNDEKYIREAILSAVAQDYRPLEIIVMDDGSIDGSCEIIMGMLEEHPVIRYFHQSNQGVSVARNNAISQSKGQYLAFLDADDLWHPGKLDSQIAHLQNGARAVTALAQPFWSPEIPEEQRHEIPAKKPLPQSPSATVIEKSAFAEVGPFTTQVCHAEWIDWVLRAKEIGITIEEISEVMVQRRIHGNNKSRNGVNDRLLMLKAHLDRSRKKQAA